MALSPSAASVQPLKHNAVLAAENCTDRRPVSRSRSPPIRVGNGTAAEWTLDGRIAGATYSDDRPSVGKHVQAKQSKASNHSWKCLTNRRSKSQRGNNSPWPSKVSRAERRPAVNRRQRHARTSVATGRDERQMSDRNVSNELLGVGHYRMERSTVCILRHLTITGCERERPMSMPIQSQQPIGRQSNVAAATTPGRPYR